MPLDILEILEKSGLKTETFEKIRLGQGVVGKTSYVVGLSIVALGIIALRVTDQFLLGGLAAAIVGLAVWHPHKTRSFAKENPALALLEGGELVAYKKIELAAKEIPTPPATPAIENPDSSSEALVQIENKK